MYGRIKEIVYAGKLEEQLGQGYVDRLLKFGTKNPDMTRWFTLMRKKWM